MRLKPPTASDKQRSQVCYCRLAVRLGATRDGAVCRRAGIEHPLEKRSPGSRWRRRRHLRIPGAAIAQATRSDGAEWIRNVADQHIARVLHPLDQPAQQRWILRHQPKLDSGQIEKRTAYLDSQLAHASPAQHEILRVETAFFDKNKDRIRYPEFRSRGCFIGSGVIFEDYWDHRRAA